MAPCRGVGLLNGQVTAARNLEAARSGIRFPNLGALAVDRTSNLGIPLGPVDRLLHDLIRGLLEVALEPRMSAGFVMS